MGKRQIPPTRAAPDTTQAEKTPIQAVMEARLDGRFGEQADRPPGRGQKR